jgi:hypothetical protein
VFSEFCEPLQQIIKHEEGVVGIPNLLKNQTEAMGPHGLRMASEVGEQFYECEPLAHGIVTVCLGIVTVMIKLNSSTASWYL